MGRAGRPLPRHKTLGTPYNLRPETDVVPVRSVRAGDVVLEGPDHPARVIDSHMSSFGWLIRARYIWQADHEPPWLMGRYDKNHLIERARKGEY